VNSQIQNDRQLCEYLPEQYHLFTYFDPVLSRFILSLRQTAMVHRHLAAGGVYESLEGSAAVLSGSTWFPE